MATMESTSTSHLLLKRCVQCPANVIPQCNNCASDETCSLTIQTCNQCASASCISSSSADSPSGPRKNTTNTGAIAGGAIGAIIVFAILATVIYLVLKRRKRDQIPYEEYTFPEEGGSEKPEGFTHRNLRNSTRTVGSVTSTGTALTWASNVIPIAYIPGVTNRSSSAIVPPVPSFSHYQSGSAHPSPQPNEGDHFFMPGEIHRDSTYQENSRMTRASVASTVYRNNAVVSPYPAQTVIRGRANVVSVRNGPASSIGSTTPEPMPAFHHELEGDSPRLDAEPMTLDPLVVGRPNRTGNHQPLSEISADPDNTRDRERDPFGTPPSSVSSVSGDAASYHSARSGERSSTAEAISRASSRQTASPNTIHEELPANEPVLPQTSESAERRLVASAAAAASSSHGDALTIPPNTYMRSSNYGSSSYGSSSTLPLAKRRSSVISPAASSSRKEASNLGAVIEDPVAAVIQEATSKASEEPTVGLGRVVQGPFGDDHEVR